MSEQEKRLIAKARERYGKIRPILRAGHFKKCHFTKFNGKLMFWFNDKNNSTHIIKEEV